MYEWNIWVGILHEGRLSILHLYYTVSTVCCSVLHIIRCVAVSCSELQRVAVYCSMLQRVAACCSVCHSILHQSSVPRYSSASYEHAPRSVDIKFHYRHLGMCAGVDRDSQYQHTPSVDGSYIFTFRRSELWPRIAPSEWLFIWVVGFFSFNERCWIPGEVVVRTHTHIHTYAHTHIHIYTRIQIRTLTHTHT